MINQITEALKLKNSSKTPEEIDLECYKFRKEVQPTLKRFNMKESGVCRETEKDLNSKILKITMMIKDQYPELYKFLEEMPVSIPDEKDPRITLKKLKLYYNSLNTILNKYILEHSIKVNK